MKRDGGWSRNRVVEGRAWLEGKREGLYPKMIKEAILKDGVAHFAPDCLLLAVPCPDAPATLEVTFACAQLGALYRTLRALGYERVRWRREWRNPAQVHERPLADYARHFWLAQRVSRP